MGTSGVSPVDDVVLSSVCAMSGLLQSSCGVPADWQSPAPALPGRPAQAARTPEGRASPSRGAKIPLCATCIGSPPVNEMIGREQEDRLGLGTYLEDAYARHSQEVVSPGLRNADEHRVAALA